MAKLKIGANAMVYPNPIVLVGAQVDGRPNYCLVGDCALAGVRWPLVTISLHEDHWTTRGVQKERAFSVNIPSMDLLDRVDACGHLSGREADKSSLFTTFYGELRTVPLIAECPVVLECRVVGEILHEKRHVFLGEVAQAHVEERFLVGPPGKRVIARLGELDPILYGADDRYYRVGEPVAASGTPGVKLVAALRVRPGGLADPAQREGS